MRNPFESIGNPRKSPEAAYIAGEVSLFEELVTRSEKRAEIEISNDENLATVFIGSGYRDQIISAETRDEKKEVADTIIRGNPHFVPDIYEDDDEGAQAYIVALAQYLDQPPYKN